MFSDSRTRAENFGISIGRHGRGHSRAPLGVDDLSPALAERQRLPAPCRTERLRPGLVLSSPQQPRKPRITPATPHRLGRRPSARQCPIECPNADATAPLGEMENPAVMRDSAVARPGLEPGTPRFSVVGPNLSNLRESLERQGFRAFGGYTGMFANCVRSPRDWAPTRAECPIATAAMRGRHAIATGGRAAADRSVGRAVSSTSGARTIVGRGGSTV